jgi:hypothetical protein
MSHYYSVDGTPHYFVPCKSREGVRPSTIKDARANNWIPGVTEIIKLLDKPALTEWKVKQGIYAVCTAPDVPGEALDAKIDRVLAEGQHQEEARRAADAGTEIHDAISASMKGEPINEKWRAHVGHAIEAVMPSGVMRKSEFVIVGEGYAGRVDLLTEDRDWLTLIDFKSVNKLPKESWLEAKLQTSAYAAALGNTNGKRIRTGNVYVDRATAQVMISLQEDWQETYERGFKPLLQYWSWVNGV